MGRRGHDGPSWTPSSYTLQILLLLSSLPSTNRYDGPFQARQSVEGLCSITLKLHWNWDYSLIITMNQQDWPSWLWRSIMNFIIPHLGQTFLSSFSCFTMMQPADHHNLDGPSQAPLVQPLKELVQNFVAVVIKKVIPYTTAHLLNVTNLRRDIYQTIVLQFASPVKRRITLLRIVLFVLKTKINLIWFSRQIKFSQ